MPILNHCWIYERLGYTLSIMLSSMDQKLVDDQVIKYYLQCTQYFINHHQGGVIMRSWSEVFILCYSGSIDGLKINWLWREISKCGMILSPLWSSVWTFYSPNNLAQITKVTHDWNRWSQIPWFERNSSFLRQLLRFSTIS